jgi:hypothetical protein
MAKPIKMKNSIKNNSRITIYKNKLNKNNNLGIDVNKILEIENFIDKKTCKNILKYLDSISDNWSTIIFYGSSGIVPQEDPTLTDFGLSKNLFDEIKIKIQSQVERTFDKKLESSTSYIQIWDIGGFASPHSDNSDFNGKPNNLLKNKYASILYLNDDYEGGELYFPEHDIQIKPKTGSLVIFPGGRENLHGIKEVTEGRRYTFAAFWDFADIQYPKEIFKKWEDELEYIIKSQNKKKKKWSDSKVEMPEWARNQMWRQQFAKNAILNQVDPEILNKDIFYYPSILGDPKDLVDKINNLNDNLTDKELISKWFNWPNDGSLGLAKTLNESKYNTSLEKNKSVLDKMMVVVEYCLYDYLNKLNVDEGETKSNMIYKYSTDKEFAINNEKLKPLGLVANIYLENYNENLEVFIGNNNKSIFPSPGSVIIYPNKYPGIHKNRYSSEKSCIISSYFWEKHSNY